MMDCNDCKNAEIDLARREINCLLDADKWRECFRNYGKHFVPRNEIETTIDAEFVATNVADIIYNQSKARIFNVLESQLEANHKLLAVKRITEDIIADIAKNASDFIKDILAYREGKVLLGDILDSEEEEKIKEVEEKAKKAYDELQKAIE